ncbi:MAG: ROK family transcriptional regulator [Acholeplasmataceae bacterium]|nr:ROK family transcriptional regulator [Acholeplasmataceae bacterium]
MKYGSDQTVARDLNVEMVLQLLKEKHMSSSDLAKRMHLSKPGLTKIMNEMIENHLVVFTEEEHLLKNNVGRKKTLYKINPNAGMVGVINFAPTHVKIVFSDLEGGTIDEVDIPNQEFIDEKTLNEITQTIDLLRSKHESNQRALLSVCIAAPGKINSSTQEIFQSPKFKPAQHIKLKDYFKKHLNVHVSLKNDINLWLLGEREQGYIDSSIEDAILVHIDTGIGGAILNKGKIVEGEQGFAGEFGLMKTFDRFGNIVYYDSICSTNSIKNQIAYYKTIGEITNIKDGFRTSDVIEAFEQQDPLVQTVVIESAKNIGILISNLYNVFDCKHIYISGRVRGFKDKYLDEVKLFLGKQSSEIELKYATCGDEAISFGARSVAIDQAFKVLIENRKRGNGNKN